MGTGPQREPKPSRPVTPPPPSTAVPKALAMRGPPQRARAASPEKAASAASGARAARSPDRSRRKPSLKSVSPSRSRTPLRTEGSEREKSRSPLARRVSWTEEVEATERKRKDVRKKSPLGVTMKDLKQEVPRRDGESRKDWKVRMLKDARERKAESRGDQQNRRDP